MLCFKTYWIRNIDRIENHLASYSSSEHGNRNEVVSTSTVSVQLLGQRSSALPLFYCPIFKRISLPWRGWTGVG